MNYSINHYNLKEIASSNNYIVYSFTLNKQRYVLRTISEKASSTSRLKKSYSILKYLNKKKIKPAETVYYLDKSHKYLISEYIDGQELGLKDLKGKYLKLFISELVKLNKLPINLQILKIVNPNQFKKRALRNAKLLNQHEKTKKIALDLIKHLKELKINKVNEDKLYFDHGDLAGANIFLSKEKTFRFIDWDNARLTNEKLYHGQYVLLR
jgi:aminoglycoside phosphotransferase (APT) family kinase protein